MAITNALVPKFETIFATQKFRNALIENKALTCEKPSEAIVCVKD